MADRPRPLGPILDAVIDRLNLRAKIDEARVIDAWAALAGPQINGVTQSVWMRGSTLYVKVRSAAWRQELHLRRRAWRERLNGDLGAAIVKEIVFR
jgi:predicted nucleic acid-binding Zn ribbon protein